MQIRAKKANLTVHITLIQIINGQQQLYIKQIQCHFISRSIIILHEFLSPSRFIIRTITSSNLTHTFLFTSLVIFLHNPQNVFLQSQTDIFGMKGQPMLQPTWWRHRHEDSFCLKYIGLCCSCCYLLYSFFKANIGSYKSYIYLPYCFSFFSLANSFVYWLN